MIIKDSTLPERLYEPDKENKEKILKSIFGNDNFTKFEKMFEETKQDNHRGIKK